METIKQLLPISDALTPMIQYAEKNGKSYYSDAAAGGNAVFLALMDDIVFGSYCLFYVIDSEGNGELKEAGVRLVSTVHCKYCGRRMMAGTTPDKPERVIYRCLCGETFDGDTITGMLGNAKGVAKTIKLRQEG